MGNNYLGDRSGRNYDSSLNLKYNVDIVMCIDATGSMRPLIDTVKKNALSFYDDLMQKMTEKNKQVNQVRVKVIAFRDYLDYLQNNGQIPMLKTDFFLLPEQAEQFNSVINSIEPKGGGDDPEDGLEALAYAIKSDWDKTEGIKHRHIIVVWTDDATHNLGFGNVTPRDPSKKPYPQKMPKSFSELTLWWGTTDTPGQFMDTRAKRLLIYAPMMESWATIGNSWDNAILYASEAAKGLDKVTYTEILDAIVHTLT